MDDQEKRDRRYDGELQNVRTIPLLSRRDFLRRSGGAAVGLAGGMSSISILAACAGSTQASTGARKGGVVRLALGDADPHDLLDPRRQDTNFIGVCQGMLFDSLVLNDTGFQPHSALATSWEPSADAKTWTYNLRRGVQFHDGTKFTSADVVHSIRLQIDKKGGSPVAGQLGAILKAENITAPDDYTVRLQLDQPNVFLNGLIGSRFMKIVKNGTTDFSQAPIGTGPFVFQEYTPGQSFSVKANPNYWQNGRPYLQSVKVTNIPEQSSKLQALLASQLDLIDTVDYPLAKVIQNSGTHQPVVLKDARWVPITMDPTVNPVFADRRVMQAMRLGVDRNQIFQTVYAGFGSTGYDNPFPASDPYFSSEMKPPQRDLASAQSLLKQAYPNGVTLELTASPLEGSMVTFGEAIQQQLQEIGFKVNLAQSPASTFFDAVWMKKPMYTMEWNRRHPDDILSLAFISKGAWNETKFKSPELDAAVAEARSTTDFAKQKAAYGVCQQILSQQDTHLMPVYTDRIYGGAKSLQGVRLNFITYCDLTNAYYS